MRLADVVDRAQATPYEHNLVDAVDRVAERLITEGRWSEIYDDAALLNLVGAIEAELQPSATPPGANDVRQAPNIPTREYVAALRVACSLGLSLGLQVLPPEQARDIEASGSEYWKTGEHRILVELEGFIDARSREFKSIRGRNLFCAPLTVVCRYRRFLVGILHRYRDAEPGIRAAVTTLHGSGRPGKLSGEQRDALAGVGAFSEILHLDIESFYQFAKILLDRTAHAVEFYFGQSRGISLRSHHELRMRLATYVEQRELTQPSTRLIELCLELQTRVLDHRDHEITHERNPRSKWGVIFSGEEGVGPQAVRTVIYPEERAAQPISEPLEGLLDLIDAYLREILAFVAHNFHKVRMHQFSEDVP